VVAASATGGGRAQRYPFKPHDWARFGGLFLPAAERRIGQLSAMSGRSTPGHESWDLNVVNPKRRQVAKRQAHNHGNGIAAHGRSSDHALRFLARYPFSLDESNQVLFELLDLLSAE